jgi:hypothetical protein
MMLLQIQWLRNCGFSLRPGKPDEVAKIIAGLNTWVIKIITRQTLPAVTHIINLSISNLELPAVLLLAKVVPLLDPHSAPIFSKILETAVILQLVEYLDSNSLLSPNNHGSRHGHNTATLHSPYSDV